MSKNPKRHRLAVAIAIGCAWLMTLRPAPSRAERTGDLEFDWLGDAGERGSHRVKVQVVPWKTVS